MAENKRKSDGELSFNVEIRNLQEAEARVAKLREQAEAITATLGTAGGTLEGYSQTHFEIVQAIMTMSQDTAPVEVSFGYVANHCCHQGIVLKTAPSSIIKAIMALPYDLMTHLKPDGLHIDVVSLKNKTKE